MTCPAYHSKYILDKKEIQKRYSLFEVDSLPKEGIGFVKKNKYGIIEEKPYRKKYNEIKDLPMKTIYPAVVDSILMVRNIADTSAVDSLGVPPSQPFFRNMNYDQIIYNSLFYDLLVPPEEEDILEELEEKPEESEAEEVEEETPGRRWNPFRRRRSEPEEEEEEVIETVPESPPDEDIVEEEDDGF